MSLTKASITMQATCAAKAKNQFLQEIDPINARIFELLPEADTYRNTMDQYSNGMFTQTVCFRKRFFAEVLDGSADNYSQLIILCGGLDFSCLANRKWESMPKFFVDHPLSLNLTLPLLAEVGVETTSIKTIGLDLALEKESSQLDVALVNEGFDPNTPTLVLWEGASYYFDKSNVVNLIGILSKLIPNLRLVLDFVLANPESTTDTNEIDGRTKSLNFVKKHNEPWQSKFLENDLIDELKDNGLKKIIYKTDKDIINEYNLDLRGYQKMFGFLIAEK